MRAKIERAEQVLARSQQLRGYTTDENSRRLVDAIDAAALRAIETTRTGLARKEATTEHDAAHPIAWHARSRIAALAAVALAVVVLATVGVVRAIRHERPAVADTLPPPSPSSGAEPAAAASSSAAAAAPDASDDPVLMELPATRSADRPQTHGSKAKGGKPQRPKFLNSRE
jgi:hypothetical protein